ncbi:ATP-binding protein [Actinoallomurus soli]|uniref:hypothetical protein n=1 Tax=Actinoallomurus soli TaxID=2952535 RepID=UPI00209340C5|nr:hypothetical protein [Actinoallomurus soli]MCO5966932.1 hypothetical protein [Actinoallomurus soli]
MIAKPDRVFDRGFEWRHLAGFVSRKPYRHQFGVVRGPWRQGKTYPVEALTRECDGFYFGATEATEWVLQTVLDPGMPLFREARYLLEEEADVRDTALYHSILAAVASGNNTRGGIAGYIGRKSADIGHRLNVLEDCHLLRRDADLFRSGRLATASPNR